MTRTIDVFFDYVCPYSYIACKRAPFLREDFDVDFNWISWEIHPERPIPSDTRLSLKASMIISSFANEINLDASLPKHVSNSHLALMGLEFSKTKGMLSEYHNRVFESHWEEKKDIADLSVLKKICSEIGVDPEEFDREMASQRFDEILSRNDDEAERIGVQLVPTYVLGKKLVVGNINLAQLKKEFKKYLG